MTWTVSTVAESGAKLGSAGEFASGLCWQIGVFETRAFGSKQATRPLLRLEAVLPQRSDLAFAER
ncbi:hypothetical protein D8911_01490 [Levilactobacillus brevis]|nr:hypothetical protein D8911_01490 [Levilactobacillus brevis]